MRRPVGVKWILVSWLDTFLSSRRVATVAMLPSALCVSDHSLGACWAFSVQPVLPSDYRPAVPFFEEWNLGQALDAVTGTRLGLFVFSLPGERFCFFMRLL
jgi:hypothetical protein